MSAIGLSVLPCLTHFFVYSLVMIFDNIIVSVVNKSNCINIFFQYFSHIQYILNCVSIYRVKCLLYIDCTQIRLLILMTLISLSNFKIHSNVLLPLLPLCPLVGSIKTLNLFSSILDCIFYQPHRDRDSSEVFTHHYISLFIQWHYYSLLSIF